MKLNRIPKNVWLALCLLFLIILSTSRAFGQYYPFYSSERELEKFSHYQQYQDILSRYNQGENFENILKDLDSLANVSLEANKDVQFLFFKNEIANLHKHRSNFIKAYGILKNSMETFRAENDTLQMEYFASLRLMRSTLYRIRNLPGKSDFKGRELDELFQAQFAVLEALGEDGEPMRNTLVDYGLALFREGRTKEAIQTMYRSRTMALKANDISSLAVADYSIISNMHNSYDLLKTQNEVLKNDIRLFESKPASIPVLLYNSHFITKVSQNYYEYFDNLDQAIFYAEKSAALLDTLAYSAHNIIAATHGNLARYYAEKGDTIKVWSHAKKARKLVETKAMSPYNRAFGYVLIAEALVSYAPDTVYTLLSALDTLPGRKYFTDKITEIKAKAYLHDGNINEAEEVILSVFDEHETIGGKDVPVISPSVDYISQYYFMSILEKAYKKQAADYTPAIVSLIDKQNTLFQKKMEEDVYSFEISGLSELYDEFLNEALPYMFELGGDEYFDEKMNIAFSAKAIQLNSIMAKNRFQSKLESDTLLFSRLLQSSRKVDRARHNLAAADTNDKDEVFNLQMELNSELIENLILRYEIDEYYRNQDMQMLKNNLQFASLSELQSQLSENEALIEFFLLDDSWGQVIVLPDTAISFFHEGEELKQKIKKERYAVLTGGETTDLGEYLFDPLLPYLKDKEELVIIPDGNLNFIPFEWLAVKDKMLIEDYAVSYSYSASLWHDLRKEHAFTQPASLLTVAPLFTDSLNQGDNHFASRYRGNKELDALPYSLEEVEGIESHMGKAIRRVQHLKGKDANLTNVKQLISNYDILHFATHGLVNPDHPERSGLFLFQEGRDEEINERNNGFFSMGELFEMELNADLMVLSACNTGRGNYIEGEGVIALPRGAILAGVPRVLASLWKIHDEKTKDIMLLFYKHLSEGKSYKKALRLAKLDAIEKGFLPLDWAGFVLIGG